MVIVVLIAFGGGCATGVLAMVPSWWRQRRVAQQHAPRPSPRCAGQRAALDFAPEHPPREGLGS